MADPDNIPKVTGATSYDKGYITLGECTSEADLSPPSRKTAPESKYVYVETPLRVFRKPYDPDHDPHSQSICRRKPKRSKSRRKRLAKNG